MGSSPRCAHAVKDFPEALLIGEIYLPIERLVAYYGRDLAGLHLPFNFSLIGAPWRAPALKKMVDEYDAALPKGGWPNWVLGNHDKPRIASRIGRAQARNAAILLLTLRGTPTVYYGDEIGMEQVEIAPEQARDPCALGARDAPGLGRDGCRTPMQWNSGPFGGFCDAQPWLPLAPDFKQENVANQRRDPSSLYCLYRRLTALRRKRKTLSIGAYRPVAATGDVFVFFREHGEERIAVALNLGDEATAVSFRFDGLTGAILVSSMGDRDGEIIDGDIDLRPNEGAVIDCFR